MAHYAFLDENNIVTEVIVGRNEDEIVDGISDWETAYAQVRGQACKRTSYNTRGGVHINGGTPYRKNYASIGMFYDEERDAFYATKDLDSLVFDESKCQWVPPIPRPENGIWYWDEATLSWKEPTE